MDKAQTEALRTFQMHYGDEWARKMHTFHMGNPGYRPPEIQAIECYIRQIRNNITGNPYELADLRGGNAKPADWDTQE